MLHTQGMHSLRHSTAGSNKEPFKLPLDACMPYGEKQRGHQATVRCMRGDIWSLSV